ncbi:hypothetical protein HYV50_06090 [Candidatus Pacearchaeota archaeon]|nr:hypothetical protein [Candidatus Pacearchaeota archaeon]
MADKIKKYLLIGVVIAVVILAIIFFNNDVSKKESLSSIASLKLNSIEWSCNDGSGDDLECGALFSYEISVSNQQESAYCRPFVDGNTFPYPNDVYSLSGRDTAGIPKADPNNNHIIKVCCNTDFVSFQKGEYQICEEILLNKLNNDKQETDTQPSIETNDKTAVSACWNSVCESGESWEYCVDCQVPCQSEYCNSKITLLCDGCSEQQQSFFPTVFEYQNQVYDCIANFLGGVPQRRFQYWIKDEDNCPSDVVSCENVGTASYFGVYFPGTPGVVNTGESEVNSTDNIRADIHETTHVFTDHLLRQVPEWYNEGVSIYLNEKVDCHPKQFEDVGNRLTIALEGNYEKLKNGEEIQFFEYPHYKGSLFFAGLELDYNCNENCFKEIFSKLRGIKELRNSRGLGETIISNSDIKQVAEEVTGYNLDELFNLLELNY